MPKSKKRNMKNTKSNKKVYSPPSLRLDTASNKEIGQFLARTEKFIYGDRWNMKHCVIQLDVDGAVISKTPFPYSIDYKQVLGNLIADPKAFALVLASEVWSTSTPGYARASLAPDRQESRSVVYVDVNGRNTVIHRSRKDNSTIQGEPLGTTVDYIADALGTVQIFDRGILARTFVFNALLMADELTGFDKIVGKQKMIESLARSDAEDHFADEFKKMALDVWAHFGNNPENEAAAIRHLFSNLPFVTPESLQKLLSDLYAVDTEIPSWISTPVKVAA